MAKLTTTDITNITGAESTAIATVNSNFSAVETALENTLSRDGTSPNTMSADIDMNGNDVLNAEIIEANYLILAGETFTGEAFSQGPAGTNGSNGAAATISVGSVTTGAAGSSASVSNVGTSSAAVFNFTIPRGNTGASGAGTGDLLAAQNLNDLASKPTAFVNIKQDATTSATGVVELSTDAEAIAKVDTSRAVTPSNLAAMSSSATFAGLVELATDAETLTGVDSVRATTPASITAKEATVAHVRANTADRVLTTDIVTGAMAEVTLTDSATIAWDMSTGIDFVVTLAGNRTLGNPTNTVVGRRGRIRVVQDGTGSRTLTKSSNHKTVGGQALTLSTAASSVDYIDYDVVSSTNIRLSLSKAWS